MKEPIQKYFQVGTIQWMSFPVSDPHGLAAGNLPGRLFRRH